MKTLLPAASFLSVTVLALALARLGAPALAFQHEEPPKPKPPVVSQELEARVAVLETELAAQKTRNDETRALLEQTLAYLEKQAKGAQAMMEVLTECEQQGFTAGENWKSRETLVAGLRKLWDGQQAGVPKLPAPPPAPKPAPPARAKRP